MSLLLALALGQSPEPMTSPAQLAFAEVKLPDGSADKNAPSNVWQEHTFTYTPWVDSGYFASKHDMPEVIRTPWSTKRLVVNPPTFKMPRGIPADPHGFVFSYIRDTAYPSETKPETQTLRTSRQRVTFGNRFQSFVMEQHHHMVEVRTINGRRFEREKWWTTYGVYSASGACNEDFNPATGARTKRS